MVHLKLNFITQNSVRTKGTVKSHKMAQKNSRKQSYFHNGKSFGFVSESSSFLQTRLSWTALDNYTS